jgi:hypothetical protein
METTEDFADVPEIELTEDEKHETWKIPSIIVHAGESFHVAAGNIKIWMIFPANFEFVRGNASSCTADEKFLAVALDMGGNAMIRVPEDYVAAGEEKTVRYSFMFMMHEGASSGDWEYAHGENSPPGMIIRPKKSG